MKFRTNLLQVGNNVGIEVPQSVIDELGGGKKPAVTVDVNGSYQYRSTVAVMGGKYLISFNAAHRAASGFGGGDDVEVTLELDTAPRVVEVPAALAEALAANPRAQEAFDSLSNSKKQLHTLPVADAKTDETRDRRVAKSIETLSS
jgi:hypothetical protein